MSSPVSRREFLKIGGLTAGSLLTAGIPDWFLPLDDDKFDPIGRARVAVTLIYVHRGPSFQSQRSGILRRDQFVDIIEEITSPNGPDYNPLWYLIPDGYVHSGRLQRIDDAYLIRSHLMHIPSGGQLGEITVPISQSFRRVRGLDWDPLYRLYYQSIHWITDSIERDNGDSWYQLTDDRLGVHHFVPATHVRPIHPDELKPLSPWIPAEQKRIEISIEEQSLVAYEGDEMVFHTKVSTGIPSKGPSPNGIPTDTPRGHFRIQSKMPSRHMGDGELTNDIEAYELPGVPWVSYFHKDGIACHGTYWHTNFGRQMSHGCVNMRTKDALWLYRWTTPSVPPNKWHRRSLGTEITIS